MASKGLYTPAEVAELLGISPDQVRRLIRKGELPAVKLGERLYRVPATTLREYLMAQPNGEQLARAIDEQREQRQGGAA